MVLFVGLYYGNVWNARAFPFLSQSLFSQVSNETAFDVFNQSRILDAKFELDSTTLEVEGLPSFAATYASYLLTTNLGVTATIAHVLIWHFDAVRDAFTVGKPNFGKFGAALRNPRQLFATRAKPMSEKKLAALDPHYRQMLVYKEVPSWWYLSILTLSVFVGLGCIYTLESTLPWWGFFVAIAVSFIGTLFAGTLAGLLGFGVPVTSLVQLIGGYLHPGKPVANMYFVLFGANAQSQAIFLIHNLKLGQYGKLSPRCNFTVQIIGTLLGALVNYGLMNSITTQQREVLLSIQGTNIWSGQVIQSFNSNVCSSP